MQAGANLVAVELHQSALATTDASFDLELTITRFDPNGANASVPLITQSTVVKARANETNTWSVLNEAFLQVGPNAVHPGDIAISELNYDPSGADDAEFVELANLGTRAANLRGARFSQGFSYRFPNNRDTLLAPGQRLVLVKDLFGFQQRYGRDVPVAGVYSGGLANEGERITLLTASSNLLTSFAYSPATPWAANAAGAGYTLVLSHPQLGLDNPAAWRSSVEPNGTPSGTDSTVFAGLPSVDGDGDGLPAVVEYALGTSDSDPASGPDAVTQTFDGLGNFTITFSRNLHADDVTLVVEASEDLLLRSPATFHSTQLTRPGVVRETWGTQVAGKDTGFLRLRVVR